MIFDPELDSLMNPAIDTLLDNLADNTPCLRCETLRALLPDEVVLPERVNEFFGWESDSRTHLEPRYGSSEDWIEGIRTRAAIRHQEVQFFTILEALQRAPGLSK
jgi:hypothetical protein